MITLKALLIVTVAAYLQNTQATRIAAKAPIGMFQYVCKPNKMPNINKCVYFQGVYSTG